MTAQDEAAFERHLEMLDEMIDRNRVPPSNPAGMTPDQRLLAIAFLVTSSLFNTGLIVAGLSWHVKAAVFGALAGLGFASISYFLQISGNRPAAVVASVASWAMPILGGFVLLVVS